MPHKDDGKQDEVQVICSQDKHHGVFVFCTLS